MLLFLKLKQETTHIVKRENEMVEVPLVPVILLKSVYVIKLCNVYC